MRSCGSSFSCSSKKTSSPRKNLPAESTGLLLACRAIPRLRTQRRWPLRSSKSSEPSPRPDQGCSSRHLGHDLVGIVGLLVAAPLLPLRQLDLRAGYLLVRDLAEEVRDDA